MHTLIHCLFGQTPYSVEINALEPQGGPIQDVAGLRNEEPTPLTIPSEIHLRLVYRNILPIGTRKTSNALFYPKLKEPTR